MSESATPRTDDSSPVYLDGYGRSFRLCDCSAHTENCPHGRHRALMAAGGFTKCLIPDLGGAAVALYGEYKSKTPERVEQLERELSAANARIAELEKDAARYLDAVFAMADDGWLMYGEEGMSLVQEEVYKIAKEHPEYKRRAAADAKP